MTTLTKLLTEQTPHDQHASLSFHGVRAEAIRAIATGAAGGAEEYLLVGSRGDGKTFGALGAMLAHAQAHEAAGFPLPTLWMSVRDSHASHLSTTIVSMANPLWAGTWRLYDDSHLAVASVGGKALVAVHLFGVEDQGALDRLRMEVVGVHFEEAAPVAVLQTSRGMREEAWATALSSRRRPSHCHPAVLTENYPDTDHWTWQRFVTAPGVEAQNNFHGRNAAEGRWYWRIPPGEVASPELRAQTATALRNHPALLARLHDGRPAMLPLGEPVVTEYREDRHAQRAWMPLRGITELYLSHDFWHHPATVIGYLTPLGQLRILFAKRLDGADIGSLATHIVKPWLAAKGLLEIPLVHTGDRTGETGDQSDRLQTAVGVVQSLLPGRWVTVSNDPDIRHGALKTALRDSLSTGDPKVLLVGPDVGELDKALMGGWHKGKNGKVVKDGEEGQHSHVGDAAAYLALMLFGRSVVRFNAEAWRNQEAYRQPWNGAVAGRDIAGAGVPMRRFNAEAWRRANEQP